MKKNLLLAFVAAGSVAFAQQTATNEASGMNLREKAARMKMEAEGQAPAPYLNTRATATVMMGSASNAYTVAFGRRDAVSVRPEINAITFVHRSNAAAFGDAGSGSLRYDHSLDGGATFTNDVGAVYNGGNARYPSGMILNNPTNTDPANASYIYTAPVLSGTNGGSWGGQLIGIAALGADTATNIIEESDPAAGDFNLISAGFCAVGQVAHHVDTENDQITALDYTDTLIYRRADLSSGSLVYDKQELYVPVYNDAGNIGKAIVDAYIGFGQDGQTGYIVVIGHGGDTTIAPVGSYHLIVLKSTDGGDTWSAPINVGLSSLVDPQLLNDGSSYTTGFEGDIAVDANGDMHFTCAVGPSSTTAWSIATSPGVWGIFDVRGDGATIAADLVATPMTFRGAFGSLNEDSRPQASISQDGKYVTISYFDTDTLLTGSTDNTFPDAYVRGYDVENGVWFDVVNTTTGTASDAVVAFGTVGDIMFKPGDTATVAIVYAELTVPGSDLDVTQFYYFGAPYSFYIDDTNLDENTVDALRLFPNPASESVRVGFELGLGEEATVRVLNAMGQAVQTTTHAGIAGGNVVELNIADLASGMYFVEVTTGADRAVERLIVK
jgi:hypothetical protein